jgi:hypothetical protein
MKIRIGKYTTYIGPYQVVEWFKPIFGDDRIEKFTDSKFFEKWSDKSMPFFNWIESKKKRKIKIQIDKFDTWGMDHTLAMIILPMLKQLKETKHGSPMVDDADVPSNLGIRSADAPSHEDWETDDNVHKRWDWVMDELIWTFTQLNDEDNDSQFHTGEHDISFKEIDSADEDGEPLYEMVPGPNDTHVYDRDAHMKHQERISNGLQLFGKYYQGLWT